MNKITVSGVISLVLVIAALAISINENAPPSIAFRGALLLVAITAFVLPFIKYSENSEIRPFLNGILIAIALSFTISFTFDIHFENACPVLDYVPLSAFVILFFIIFMLIANLVTKKQIFGDSTFGRMSLFTMCAIVAFTAVFHFVFLKTTAMKELYELDISQFFEISAVAVLYGGGLWIGGLNAKSNNNKILPILTLLVVLAAEVVWIAQGGRG